MVIIFLFFLFLSLLIGTSCLISTLKSFLLFLSYCTVPYRTMYFYLRCHYRIQDRETFSVTPWLLDRDVEEYFSIHTSLNHNRKRHWKNNSQSYVGEHHSGEYGKTETKKLNWHSNQIDSRLSFPFIGIIQNPDEMWPSTYVCCWAICLKRSINKATYIRTYLRTFHIIEKLYNVLTTFF